MAIEADTQGRIYLPAELRAEYGEKFHVVRYEDRIELIPIAEDPLQAVRDAVGDAFDEKSIRELKQEARISAKQEARDDLERSTESITDGDE